MTTLLLATTNAGKLREIRTLLEGLPLVFASLEEFSGLSEHEERGATFEENAREKARYYAVATGLLTVAEDSGLEIDALDGAPGVASARFPGTTYADKFTRLYGMLDQRGTRHSACRFVCALALAHGNDVLFETRGTVEGLVAPEPRGTSGFGYDPIFLHPATGLTLAEMGPTAKDAISHRGQAFRALRAFLEHRALAF